MVSRKLLEQVQKVYEKDLLLPLLNLKYRRNMATLISILLYLQAQQVTLNDFKFEHLTSAEAQLQEPFDCDGFTGAENVTILVCYKERTIKLIFPM